MAVLRKVRTVGAPWMDMMSKCTPGGDHETAAAFAVTDRYNRSMKWAHARGGNRKAARDRRKDPSMDENSDATNFRTSDKEIDGMPAYNLNLSKQFKSRETDARATGKREPSLCYRRDAQRARQIRDDGQRNRGWQRNRGYHVPNITQHLRGEAIRSRI